MSIFATHRWGRLGGLTVDQARSPVVGATLWLSLVLALVACGSGPKVVYEVPADATILAFGDSLTAGVGASAAQSYPAQLAALTGWSVVNAGVSGETTSQGLRRLPRVLDEVRPDVVLLCLGGNDLLRKQSQDRMRENLREMLSLIRAANAQPILIAVPEPALIGMDDHAIYAQLAAEEGVPLIAGVMTQTLKKSALRADRIHPNAAGYTQIAQSVGRALGGF